MNRKRIGSSRWLSAAVIAAWLWVPSAPAQPAHLATIDGVYLGSYAVDQSTRVRGQTTNASAAPIKFKLSITQDDLSTLTGTLTLYVPEDAETKSYSCDVTGTLYANRTFQLRRIRWQGAAPTNVNTMAMNGTFDSEGGKGAGRISGKVIGRPTADYEAVRDAAESAGIATATADTKQPEPPATPPVRPRRRSPPSVAAAGTQPIVATPGAPPVSAAAQAPGFKWRGAINGAYTVTYGTNADDNVAGKLYIKFIEDGSVDGILNGVFTFDVPPSPGAQPITYTYKLIGRSYGGRSGFHSAKPVGRAPPNAYALDQLWVEFDRSLVKANHGGLESKYDPDQLSGWVLDRDGIRTNLLKVARDTAGSADVDGLMAAQLSAAGRPQSIPSAPARPGSPPASAPSSDVGSAVGAIRSELASAPVAPIVRTGIEGVFNGTYTRENEPPTKFKLTITRTRDGRGGMAAGMATIYLPTGSGTKAYTYSLLGHYSDTEFELKVSDWETTPPKDFKNFRAMGFSGEFRSNATQNTARILSVPQAARPVAVGNSDKRNGPSKKPAADVTFFVPTFEATWDAKESADIPGTLAAQKAVGDADRHVALKEHAEDVKHAQPKQLASKYLVRKSQAYWDRYRSDFIREVLNGGFASDVDIDPAFQTLFIDYVDLFSKTCAAYLPADHKPVTITIVTTTTYPGGHVDVDRTSKTVDVDSRFIAKYVEYSGVPGAPGSDQEKRETEKTIAIAGKIFNSGGPSHGVGYADAIALIHLAAAHGIFGGTEMARFFEDEVKAGHPSAALRQMGENLLRGATGELSLQEAGAMIDGAEAETDRGLPPGRFTHLVDAAHAFYREPGNARLESRFETAFDETLAMKYRGVITREEEYYYANDYGNRFRGQIMQPRSYCKDPEWPRLHPAVEECIAELQQ